MVNVKIIKRPKTADGKSGGTALAVNSGSSAWADRSGHADEADTAKEARAAVEANRAKEADHALTADTLSEDSPVRGEFLSRVNPDTAQGRITFENGLEATDVDTFNATIGTADIGETVTTDIHSPSFIPGMQGFQISLQDGKAVGELDRLTVRERMTVYEMIIRRVKAVGGELVVSAADGKIKEVEYFGDRFKLFFEETNTYQVGDLLRCQSWNTVTNESKFYWVEVLSVASDNSFVTVSQNDFDTDNKPQAGDQTVLFGSTSDPDRQGLLWLTATDDGKPRLDVLGGISGKSLNGTLRARLGCLDGIRDGSFPADNQPQGDGLYANNAYLRGSFTLASGEDVKTLFEIIDGRLTSAIDGFREVKPTDGGIIRNPMFADGFAYWNLYLPGNVSPKFLKAGNGVLHVGTSPLMTGKWIGQDTAKHVRLTGATGGDTYAAKLLQQFADFDLTKFAHRITDKTDTEFKAFKVKLLVTYRAVTAGTMTVQFLGKSEDIAVTADSTWKTWEKEIDWDGTKGGLAITTDCHVDIAAVTLSDEASTYYRTEITQTKEAISLNASKISANETAIANLTVTADEISSTVTANKQDADGKFEAMESTITQTADEIKAEVKDGLIATGIDIENRKITLKADSTVFQDNDGNEIAAIEDGRIKAGMVDVASKTEPKRRVLIDPDNGDIVIYDKGGDECQRLTGEARSASDLFSQSGSGDYTVINASGKEEKKTSQTAVAYQYKKLTAAKEFKSQTRVKVKSGTLHAFAEANTYSETRNTPTDGEMVAIDNSKVSAEAQLVVAVYDKNPDVTSNNAALLYTCKVGNGVTATSRTIEGTALPIHSTSGTPQESLSHVSTGAQESTVEVNASAMIKGWARLELRYRLICKQGQSGAGVKASVTWGTRATKGKKEAIAAEWTADEQRSEYFKGGYIIGESSKKYVAVYKDPTNGTTFAVESDNQGLRVNNKHVQAKRGTVWCNIPLTLANLYVAYNSTAQTYTPQGAIASGLTMPKVTRTASGKVKMAFSDWQTKLGGSDLMNANIIGFHVSSYTSKAQITSSGASNVDLDLGSDGAFRIMITLT